jgi:4-amino-4-deoxy-L-arabinose transferase-like glycosyltransferase
VARLRLSRFGLPAVLALAALNFLWQLGSSSYFVDELLSIDASGHPASRVIGAISRTEIAPPAYFFFQHEWLGRVAAHREWAMRLPSAIAGILLVAAVYWLGRGVSSRSWVAPAAAVIAALSPLLLQYSQLAQGYVFAALFATTAVASAFHAGQARERQGMLLVCSAVCACLAILTNYTASLVILSLCVWLLGKGSVRAGWRRGYVAACGVAQVAVLPLFIVQWHNEPGRTGVGKTADLTVTNALRLIEAPFDGRVDPLRVAGVFAVLVALAALVVRRARLDDRQRLVLGVTVGIPVLLMVLSAFGARVALTRYALVAAPFMITALVLGLSRMPAALGALLGVLVLVVACLGLAQSHRRSGFYADLRGAVETIQRREQAGDVLIVPSSPALSIPLGYYAQRLRPPLVFVSAGDPRLGGVLRSPRRLWVLNDLSAAPVDDQRLLAAEGQFALQFRHRAIYAHVVTSTVPLGVALWGPTP